MNFIEITVEDHEKDQRIDRFLRKKYPHLSQSGIEQGLRKNLIKLNNSKVESKTYIDADNVIKIAEFLTQDTGQPREKAKPRLNLPEKKIQFWLDRILYQDDNIIIINKPTSIATQGGTGITQSIDDILEVFQFDNPERPKLVHRLDKETSGVLILARSRQVATKLSKMFQEKSIRKIYHAVLAGDLHGSGIIKQPVTDYDTGERKSAITEYRVLDSLKGYLTLVELSPLTGRKHQLRIHCAENLQRPILADFDYGRDNAYVQGFGNKMHLHAKRVMFELDGKKINASAPIPDHFVETYRIAGFKDKD